MKQKKKASSASSKKRAPSVKPVAKKSAPSAAKKRTAVSKSVSRKKTAPRSTTAKRKPKAAAKKSNDSAVAPRMRLRIIGVGGGGGTIVQEIAQRVPRADFFAANTDSQALRDGQRKVKTFSFGQEFTQGLGCGMNAELGEKAARAEKERIKKLFEGQDVCILVASLGGGTGSGALPVFAQVASESKCLTLGVFTLPFHFEGEKRQQIAKAALERAKAAVNAYITIPNENIFHFTDANLSFRASLSAVNKYLAESLEGLIETIYLPGLINVDFADLKSLLEGRGKLAYVNSSLAGGPTRAKDVAQQVLDNPLLGYGIGGTERMLFNITSDRSVKMHEMVEISDAISSFNAKARIIFGISHQPKLRDKIRVTLFTAGCREPEAKAERKPKTQEGEKTSSEKKAEKAAPKQSKSKKANNPSKKATKKEVLSSEAESEQDEELAKTRRNGLEVKRAVDEELQELEEKEKQWDVPAFLRNKASN